MNLHSFFLKLKRVSKKPPKIIFERILFEINIFLGQFITPLWVRLFSDQKFLTKVNSNNIEELWMELSQRPYFSNVREIDPVFFTKYCLEEYQQIKYLAELAFANKINLLGTGLVELGEKIDWHKDYKSNIRWSPKYISKISYSNPYDSSDVKIPWEISRMQWLIPLGQLYLLDSREEQYAKKVKDILIDWIKANPYAQSVNWACTMEVAIRLFTWSWFFHVFHNSVHWQDKEFKSLFLKNLWLHGKFTEKHLESSDVNGNHFTADAAGMVIVGLFFGKGKDALRWHEAGWRHLENELPKQVFLDGVNYEASVPYHRLVLELFLYPAIMRKKNGLEVSDAYANRIESMAWFSSVSTRTDGTVPVWGDADDARALPFRFNDINDHRYLVGLVGIGLGKTSLLNYFHGSVSELFWMFNNETFSKLIGNIQKPVGSFAFQDGGFYVIRDDKNHIFIDCGPVGLAGRGGHGHNDILSFEVYIKGQPLIVDSGSYLYTANYAERNHFRSTAYHNTPQIDGVEINRFIRSDYLWNLHNDAIPHILKWDSDNNGVSIFKGSHTGYLKLEYPITPIRTIVLEHSSNCVFIKDEFDGEGVHDISIPFHFHPNVTIEEIDKSKWKCNINNEEFTIINVSGIEWQSQISDSRVSFSYGVYIKSKKLVFKLKKGLKSSFILAIISSDGKRYVNDPVTIKSMFI